jgi:DNA invertase Pin-like site-specific DNA recombinase
MSTKSRPSARRVADATYKPQRAILLCRISDADDDDTHGVDLQEKRLREKAAALGWGILRVEVENDTSAFKRRTVTLVDGSRVLRTYRPKFRRTLDALMSGEADGFLALDLDRTCRDPRDLEDLIDVIESRNPRIPVESITGSLRLANDADVTMARVMVAIANKSSRDTSRRVADHRLARAEAGLFGGGPRPYGFESDGVTRIEDECTVIADATKAVIAGASLRSLCRQLIDDGVKNARGKVAWIPETLRGILLRERNAGLIVYRGEILEGVDAPWKPIVDRETWEACCAKLNDPSRRSTPGPAPRWLGSGIYQCGHADCIDVEPAATMRVGTSGGRGRRQPAYGCARHRHLTRSAAPLDEYVTLWICALLARPESIDLLAPRAVVDVGALHERANTLRRKLDEAKELWRSDVLTAAEYASERKRIQAVLDDITVRIKNAAGDDPLAGIAGQPDAPAIWAALPLAQRRAIVKKLVTVTVLPQPLGRPRGWQPGGSYFNPDTVRIVRN